MTSFHLNWRKKFGICRCSAGSQHICSCCINLYGIGESGLTLLKTVLSISGRGEGGVDDPCVSVWTHV